MRYLVVSRCDCVGAGDMQSPEEIYSIFRTLDDAKEKFSERLKANKETIKSEIRTIRHSETLIFDSPYIVWAAILEIPIDCDSAEQATEYLLAAAEEFDAAVTIDKVPYTLLRYQGMCFEADGPGELNSPTENPNGVDQRVSDFPIESAMASAEWARG